MAYFTRRNTYTVDTNVLMFAEGVRSPEVGNIRKENLSPDRYGYYSLAPGVFIVEQYNSAGELIDRPLPRALLKVAATTADTELSVTNPLGFKSGDVLYILEPYVALTVSGTSAGSIIYQGRTYSYTPTGAANATEAATLFADYFSTTALANFFRFTSATNTLYVTSADGVQAVPFSVTGTLGTGAQTMTINDTALGTVLVVNEKEGKLVLSATCTTAVGAGLIIGGKYNRVKGLFVGPVGLDFTHNQEYNTGLVTQGTVREATLAHWDRSILWDLPNLDVR